MTSRHDEVSSSPRDDRRVHARYANENGNLRFPLDEPIPYDLIERLTRLRAKQDAAQAATRRRKA